MIADAITCRLSRLPLSETTRRAVQHLVAHEAVVLLRHRPIAKLFDVLPPLLDGNSRVVAQFQAAWSLMYAAAGRLDSLQDGDPIAALPEQISSPAAHYNLVFVTYVLAAGLLDDLAPLVPPERMVRLNRLWSDALLQMGDGQQQDLAEQHATGDISSLDTYQGIAEAKTGATYALAFGGLAVLFSDDAELCAALTRVGAIYGTLVQFVDDLRDARTQPNVTLTLVSALSTLPLPGGHTPERVEAAFWIHLFPIYRRSAQTALHAFPALQAPITGLFDAVFAAPAAE